MNKGMDMNKYLFYTYRASDGGDQIIPIEAASRDDAIAEFDFIYGEQAFVDMIVEAIPPFDVLYRILMMLNDTQKVGPVNTTYLDPCT